jgi:2-amino-4-hydroxy-6-hydroxymethyldihydropteridine diphosphokinase
MSGQLHLIALGANLPSAAGPPRATLEAALALLAARGFAVAARSRWRRTPAFPPGSGPDYVNGAAALASPGDPGLPGGPEAVLEALHAVERALGRDRRRRWEARVCDLDLLASGDAVLPDRATAEAWMRLAPAEASRRTPPRLILPHPRLHERGFVLAPLADFAPDWVHPLLGLSVRELLERLPPEALAGVETI